MVNIDVKRPNQDPRIAIRRNTKEKLDLIFPEGFVYDSRIMYLINNLSKDKKKILFELKTATGEIKESENK
jgi:hypothetical protein